MDHLHGDVCGKNWVGRDHQIHHCVLASSHRICLCGCEARKLNTPALKDFLPNKETVTEFFSRFAKGKYRPRPSSIL
jgi:hypothetical protein